MRLSRADAEERDRRSSLRCLGSSVLYPSHIASRRVRDHCVTRDAASSHYQSRSDSQGTVRASLSVQWRMQSVHGRVARVEAQSSRGTRARSCAALGALNAHVPQSEPMPSYCRAIAERLRVQAGKAAGKRAPRKQCRRSGRYSVSAIHITARVESNASDRSR